MNRTELVADLRWGFNEASVFLGYLTKVTAGAAESMREFAEVIEHVERAEADRRVHGWKGDWIL